jgi:hypothetical protein
MLCEYGLVIIKAGNVRVSRQAVKLSLSGLPLKAAALCTISVNASCTGGSLPVLYCAKSCALMQTLFCHAIRDQFSGRYM